MINNVRKNNQLLPLIAVENCILEARYNSESMSAQQNLAHDRTDEKWSDRIQKFNALGETMAENIALSPNEQRLIDQWMGSPDHKKNILNPKFNLTGVGYHKKYWTQCFIQATNPQQKLKDSTSLIKPKPTNPNTSLTPQKELQSPATTTGP